MKAFIWNKHFITEISEVDNQHKILVDIVNKIGIMIMNNKSSYNDIKLILDNLLDYAKFHFESEEQLMKTYNIVTEHKLAHLKSHQSFIKEIIFISSSISVDSTNKVNDLFNYLIHWLAYHILIIDKEMATMISYIKRGIEPKEAYIIEKDMDTNNTEPLLEALKGLFKQVSQKNEKLTELNSTLEKKVKERTIELKKLNDHLKKLSLTDPLTGLKNRRYGIMSLESLWEKSNKNNADISCLMIDADNFKIINDTYGHDAGDIVIKSLAKELETNIKKPNVVCRLGGDEFLVILPNTNIENAILIAENLRSIVSKLKVEANEGYWKGSISIGISSKTEKNDSYDNLLKNADLNVYEAKRAGKNCCKSSKDIFKIQQY